METLKEISTHVYTMPFKDYTKLGKAELEDLYNKYIILGVREWISKGHILLVSKGEFPDYE